jgi:hypothetical protein
LPAHEVRGQRRQPINLAFRPPKFERDVTALDIAKMGRRYGSKREDLFASRTSAFAGCGHSARANPKDGCVDLRSKTTTACGSRVPRVGGLPMFCWRGGGRTPRLLPATQRDFRLRCCGRAAQIVRYMIRQIGGPVAARA